MRFLFYAPQMASYGGMERHVCLLAGLLGRRGHAVSLLTTSNSLNETWRGGLQETGVELIEMPQARGSASKLGKLRWLLGSVRRLRRSPWDFIYTNGQSSLAQLVWLARKRGTRIAHHHHTAADTSEQRTWHPMFRRALARAPEVIACSESTKARLTATLRREGITFLPYLTPPLLPSTAVQDRSYDAGSLLRIGFAGRLVESKGIDTICALSNEPALTGIRWRIHGSGEDYPASYFAAYPNVEYCGPFHGPTECARVLERLDALALFSRHNEGMPLSLIEAMAAGLPWIATDQGGTREMAVVPENCEVVPRTAPFGEIRERTLALAGRMRAGTTSRLAQRRAYDANFAPEKVGERWLRYFGCA